MIDNKILKNIIAVTSDSRAVEKGGAFVAIKGGDFNGHAFIPEAIESGANLIVVDEDYSGEVDSRFVKVANTRLALSFIAAKIHNKQPKNIVAVTGTNGKTSVAYFYQQITELLGNDSSYMGTLGVLNYKSESKTLTTPDTVEIHKILDKLSDDGITHICLEASSHGLLQERVSNVNITAAAFTNISQDHLDYHGTIEEYFNSKMLLFNNVMRNGIAVINSDIDEFDEIEELCKQNKHKIITYGKSAGADLRIDDIENIDGKQIVKLSLFGKEYKVKLNIIGEFQIYNILCSIGLAYSTSCKIEDIVTILEKVNSPPGRMEIVINQDSKIIIVDFAHTPDALEKALQTLRMATKGKLIVLFGCGGMRDNNKRPIMGEIAKNNADIVIVSDDNPREEDPIQIRNHIMQSCPEALNIGGREEAIKYAIDIMEEGDVVLIAGKGHEDTQIIGKEEREFSDQKKVKEYFKIT